MHHKFRQNNNTVITLIENFNFWRKFKFLTKISIFDENFNRWRQFQFFDENFSFYVLKHCDDKKCLPQNSSFNLVITWYNYIYSKIYYYILRKSDHCTWFVSKSCKNWCLWLKIGILISEFEITISPIARKFLTKRVFKVKNIFGFRS